MGDLPGLVRLSIALRIQPNDGPVFFKVDGQRFGQNRTIKLLTGSSYKVEVKIKPTTLQVENISIGGVLVPLELKSKEPDEDRVVYTGMYDTEGVAPTKSGERQPIQITMPQISQELCNTYGAPVEHLWSTCGAPVEHLWSTCGAPVEHLWSTCGAPMEHLWSTYGAPVEHLWSTCGAPMEHLWSTYGAPVEHLWSTYGTPVEHLWSTYGAPVEHLWNTCGAPMEHLWSTYGAKAMRLSFYLF